MSITPNTPAEASREKFKHGSNLSGKRPELYRVKFITPSVSNDAIKAIEPASGAEEADTSGLEKAEAEE
jgi:hypothetical protein